MLHHYYVIRWRVFFRVTGLLCGEFTVDRWIPRTKTSDAELWYLFFICVGNKSWENNGCAGDLIRHNAHYDVTVMMSRVSRFAFTLDFSNRSHQRWRVLAFHATSRLSVCPPVPPGQVKWIYTQEVLMKESNVYRHNPVRVSIQEP